MSTAVLVIALFIMGWVISIEMEGLWLIFRVHRIQIFLLVTLEEDLLLNFSLHRSSYLLHKCLPQRDDLLTVFNNNELGGCDILFHKGAPLLMTTLH